MDKILRRPETSAFGWTQPKFFCGNAFQIGNKVYYDRIYCGALVPSSNRSFFCNMLKIDGILIMPYGLKVKRIYKKIKAFLKFWLKFIFYIRVSFYF